MGRAGSSTSVQAVPAEMTVLEESKFRVDKLTFLE